MMLDVNGAADHDGFSAVFLFACSGGLCHMLYGACNVSGLSG